MTILITRSKYLPVLPARKRPHVAAADSWSRLATEGHSWINIIIMEVVMLLMMMMMVVVMMLMMMVVMIMMIMMMMMSMMMIMKMIMMIMKVIALSGRYYTCTHGSYCGSPPPSEQKAPLAKKVNESLSNRLYPADWWKAGRD